MALVKYNNNSISSVTALDSIASGSLVLLATNNITSGVSSSSFTSNIDSTYDTYIFKWINIHPGTDDVNFQVNFRDGGSSYDATKTSTVIDVSHTEDDTTTASLTYKTAADVAQGTGIQALGASTGADNDQSTSGELWLFNPSSTTYVKHWMSRSSQARHSDGAQDFYTAGYCNVTAAIDGVQFTYQSGDIDTGTIKLYGIKDS